MKILILTILLFCFTFQGLANEKNYETAELIEFVQEVRDYFKDGTGSCVPKYSFEDRKYLVSEFLTIKDQEIKEVSFQNSHSVSIFLKRQKPERPGLSLKIDLNNGKCREFYIYEIMN